MSTDVLRWPVIGSALRWRHARTTAQLALLATAVVVVLHGLVGPQFAPGNLATVLTWIHYRGLLVVALLAAGNFFCMGCPMVRVRDWGRRAHAPTRKWPHFLRGKWIGIVLFAAVLFSYELFDLWALPGATAWLVLAYFGAALMVDLVFQGASFCKYVCPIGQFNFVASTVSPLELRVRSPEVCRTCATFDCIKGRRSGTQRGCELGLFLPAKVGNLDCTFCLDCVQACPHDNVALATRLPGAEWLESRRRSGLGRLSNRPDLAVLAVLFTFGGLLNAFAMTPPAHHVQAWLTRSTGTPDTLALAALFVVGLGLLPLVLLGSAALLTLQLAPDQQGFSRTLVRFACVFVPVGMGIWLAHYGFHLLTGLFAVIPAAQSAVHDLVGWPMFGNPVTSWTGLAPRDVLPLQVGVVLLGALGSVALAYGVSDRDYSGRAGVASAPWVAAVVAITSAALWTIVQPMEMRGMAHESMARGSVTAVIDRERPNA